MHNYNLGSGMTSSTENQLISINEQLSCLPGQLISHEINKYRYTPNSEEPSLQHINYTYILLDEVINRQCSNKVHLS